MFVVFLLPPLTTQMTHLAQDLPDLRARILAGSRPSYPAIQAVVRELFEWSLVPAGVISRAIVRLGSERRLGRGRRPPSSWW